MEEKLNKNKEKFIIKIMIYISIITLLSGIISKLLYKYFEIEYTTANFLLDHLFTFIILLIAVLYLKRKYKADLE